jgi:hypothetical protein
MSKKRLDQYKGKLDPGQIAEGMNAALEMAKACPYLEIGTG